MTISILAIETSCDETAAAVVDERLHVLSNIISSQTAEHGAYGGVVPELAARRHLENLVPVIDRAMQEARITPQELAAVAVTRGPGLIGALLVGVQAAKSLAQAWEKPLIGVHHLSGHIAANWLDNSDPPGYPAVCLVVSGGHTHLYYLAAPGRLRLLGRTRDDAAGEAFDKVARLIGAGYPGGPQIDKLASQGNLEAIRFPRAMEREETSDFSFSGLKTAVSHYLEGIHGRLSQSDKADLSASFQQAVLDMISVRLWSAVERYGVRQVLLAGGVAANSGLRRQLADEADDRGIRLCIPDAVYCTDNAAMIAAAAWPLYRRRCFDGLDMEPDSRLEMAGAGL